MANEELIETVDENGNKVTFELLDIVTVDDVEYALLLPTGEEQTEDDEVLVMRLKKDGEEYTFEAIEDLMSLKKLLNTSKKLKMKLMTKNKV